MAPPLVLTGASSGVGESLARHLAGEYHVVALARRVDRMREAFADEPSITPYELDLADLDGVRRRLDELVDAYGPVSYVVNNAAVNVGSRIEHLDAATLEHSMRVNAVAPTVILQQLLPAMVERDFGRVVNVTSGAPLNCPPGAGAYSASKAALNTLTVTAAHENRNANVKINLMSPGPCRTEMAPSAPLDPSACHPTADYLLDLDADGPTGRLFWLGYEVPLFPDLGDIQWEDGRPGDVLVPVLDGAPHRPLADDEPKNPGAEP